MQTLPETIEKIDDLSKRIKDKLGANLKVSFRDIKKDYQLHVNGDKHGWAASMIKVPVMVAVFRDLDAGYLTLDDQIAIDHKFTLDPSSEISDRPQGSQADIFELVNYMILASCNESTNMLANRLGVQKVNEHIKPLGLNKTRLGHLLHRGAQLIEPGIDGTFSNTTTPNDMTQLMHQIYTDQAATPSSCEHMRAVLEKRPEIEYVGRGVNNLLRRYLPKQTIVGAKIGELDNDIMETGVVNRDYALCVMINKIPEKAFSLGQRVIGSISRNVYEAYYSK